MEEHERNLQQTNINDWRKEAFDKLGYKEEFQGAYLERINASNYPPEYVEGHFKGITDYHKDKNLARDAAFMHRNFESNSFSSGYADGYDYASNYLEGSNKFVPIKEETQAADVEKIKANLAKHMPIQATSAIKDKDRPIER